MEISPEVLVGGAVGGGILGSLLKNIVWDWLKKGKGGDAMVKIHCPDHQNCLLNMESTKNCLAAFKRTYAADNATVTTMVKNIKERLADGDSQMKDMKKEMRYMSDSIIHLATIIEQRFPPGGVVKK